MKNSIENRSPFLSKLVNYSLSVKNSNYINDGYTKYLLLGQEGHTSQQIRLEKKIGFNSNLQSVTELKIKKFQTF